MDRKKILQELIDSRFGGSQAGFARAIKRSPAQVHQWLSGYRMIGDAGSRHIEMTLNLPTGWMDGKQINFPNKEIDLSGSGFTPIQVYSIGVVHWRDIEKYLSGDKSVVYRTIPSTLNEDGAFAITLEESDDSMEPEFSGGSILVVNPNKTPKSGSFVVARTQPDGPLTVKQLVIDAGQNYLKPANQRYPIISAPGLVVEALVRQHVVVRDFLD